MTSDGTHTYRWDAENRLVGATIPGATPGSSATVASYVYDEFDRRVKKTVGSATTYYLWSGDELLAEYAGNGTLQRRYLYSTGFAPSQVHHVSGATTTAYDVHTDHLDTPRLLTNSTGVAVWRSRHGAFGKAHIEGDPDADGTAAAFPFRFPGQYEDPETGLHYNRYRYYSPEIGRYLSPDPLGQFDSANLYPYALNDPLNETDSQGLLLDTFVDVVSIGYDIYKLATSECDAEYQTNLLALKLDLLAMVIPGVTGAGFAIRAARAADNAADNAADVARTARAADNAGDVARGANTAAPPRAPDFVVSPGGTAFPVPRGTTGPVPSFSPTSGKQTGVAFTGGRGGANQQVYKMRIMNPTPPKGKSPGYPKGYVKYENDRRQPVNPYTGRTGSHAETHFPLD